MIVRAFFTAVKVEGYAAPYDTLHMKVYYPAALTGSDVERNTGNVAADRTRAPFPIVVFLSGVNVGAEAYGWLAECLVQRGMVFVTFNWVGETLPGVIGLTPGVDLKMLRPETYGKGATGSALPAVFAELERIQDGRSGGSALQGLLDLEHVVLGGHSAGGTIALQNADVRYFPQVKAAFAYGAHTMAATMLGFAPGTVLPLSPLPMLLLGGTEDGVIAASSGRYGENGASNPIVRTFRESVQAGALVMLEGANHFTFTHVLDTTTGRGFLEAPATQPEEQLRALMAELVCRFIEGQELTAQHPLIVLMEEKKH